MTTVTTVCLVLLMVAGGLCLARVLRPTGSLADRIIGLDALLIVLVASVAVLIVRTGAVAFLDIVVIAILLGFIATITVGRFIERRGA